MPTDLQKNSNKVSTEIMAISLAVFVSLTVLRLVAGRFLFLPWWIFYPIMFIIILYPLEKAYYTMKTQYYERKYCGVSELELETTEAYDASQRGSVRSDSSDLNWFLRVLIFFVRKFKDFVNWCFKTKKKVKELNQLHEKMDRISYCIRNTQTYNEIK